MPVDKIPDVVLVKKVYAEKSLRNRKRKWKLKHMDELHEGTGSVTRYIYSWGKKGFNRTPLYGAKLS